MKNTKWTKPGLESRTKCLHRHERIGTAIPMKRAEDVQIYFGRIRKYYSAGNERQRDYYKIAHMASRSRELIDLPVQSPFCSLFPKISPSGVYAVSNRQNRLHSSTSSR